MGVQMLMCWHARGNSMPNCQVAKEELAEYKKTGFCMAPEGIWSHTPKPLAYSLWLSLSFVFFFLLRATYLHISSCALYKTTISLACFIKPKSCYLVFHYSYQKQSKQCFKKNHKMSSASRAWIVATSVGVVEALKDQGICRWNSALRLAHHYLKNQARSVSRAKRLSSSSSSTTISNRLKDEKAKQSGEFLRTVMYLSCWAPITAEGTLERNILVIYSLF